MAGEKRIGDTEGNMLMEKEVYEGLTEGGEVWACWEGNGAGWGKRRID